MSLFAEDAKKVARIAAGSRAALRAMYGDAIGEVASGPVGLTKTGNADVSWGVRADGVAGGGVISGGNSGSGG
eukprot:CAMPEP_0197576120 /NCGR_PEP_ID=MMETSP1326-20131121/1258_1 /TAXON_ID=1155430 /ORGANISM="Genus nov. species nov., Strain RCC2288" /LENGTH=72 /DNA_ID=CAMNT_0043138979 /DNA_START=221 /DNA_END=435 /DNA_ORIENTATION=-